MHFGLIVVAVWVLLTALWYILPTARADVYDLLLARTTEKWYAPQCSLAGPWTLHLRKGCTLTISFSLHVHRVDASSGKGLQCMGPYRVGTQLCSLAWSLTLDCSTSASARPPL